MTEVEAIYRFAAAWNTLDPELIVSRLAANAE